MGSGMFNPVKYRSSSVMVGNMDSAVSGEDKTNEPEFLLFPQFPYCRMRQLRLEVPA